MARLTEMTNGDIRKMYVENRIYTSPYSVAKHGMIVSVPHEGRRIAIQAKPIAPVADYEKWLRNRNRYRGYGGKYSAAKVRRVVIMRRQGSSWKECGEAVGVSGSAAKSWVEFLPFELSI